jgi:5-methylcytosine-specific restriction endonuclease McrA
LCPGILVSLCDSWQDCFCWRSTHLSRSFYIDGHSETPGIRPPSDASCYHIRRTQRLRQHFLMVPCIDCNRLLTAGTRCPACRKANQRKHERNRSARPGYRKAYSDPVYLSNRKTLLASAVHCRICGHLLGSSPAAPAPPGHSCKPEVDHILPLSLGGGNELKNLQVVCRSCNQERRKKS